jgi:hypothetical protein
VKGRNPESARVVRLDRRVQPRDRILQPEVSVNNPGPI